MAKAPTQRVTKRSDEKWQHKQDGNERATKVTDTQKEAIKSAVDSAKKQHTEIEIHGEDGKIRSRDSYGNDLNPPKAGANTSPTVEPPDSTPHVWLHQILDEHFNDEELRTLCFDLDVDYDNLSGSNKVGKARELIRYCQRHDWLNKLQQRVMTLRPKVTWSDSALIATDSTPALPRSVAQSKVWRQIDASVGFEAFPVVSDRVIRKADISETLYREGTTDHVACSFTVIGNMRIGRKHHLSELLSDGRILIVGGVNNDGMPPEEIMSSGEILDPASGASIAKTHLTFARYFAASTLLADNTVLVTGGAGEHGEALDSAEIYDPNTGAFSVIGRMTTARRGHVAVRLLNGKVLILGGDNAADERLASAETFDPIERTFSVTGAMSEARLTEHTPNAVILCDGRVLVVGGYGMHASLASIEAYDPASGTFARLGNMAVRRAGHALTVLNNGKRVLITGGDGSRDTAEIFDPDSCSTMLVTKMYAPHFLHTATLLPSGKVLVIGGFSPLTELYDPEAAVFEDCGSLTTSRYLHTTILSAGHRVLVIGGADRDGRSLSSVEKGSVL